MSLVHAGGLARYIDWPERLAAYLAQARPLPFAWGTHDCVTFAAGAVHAITGQQVLPLSWPDASHAARALRSMGGLPAAVGSVLPALAAPELAQRGDVVLVQTSVHGGRARRQWLGLVDGNRWWTPSATGLKSGPMDSACRAWGVGHG